MGNIGHWFWHLVRGMAQGCLFLAIAALVVSFVGTLVATGHMPTGWEVTLIASISIVSGLLGAAGALAWRLSHIGEVVQVAKDISEHGVRLP